MSGVRTSDRLALVSSGMSAPAARAEVTSSGVPWFGWALVGGGVLVIGGLCAFASHVAGGRAAASRARFAAALSEAIKDGDSKTVSTMLKQQRLDVNALHQGELPLVVSVHTGDTDIVLELVGAGADVNKRMNGDTTALMAACTLGRTAIVKVLLHAGAEPSLTDETGFHAAHMAARMGHLPCLQELGAACPGILDTCRASDGATPLMLAAADNHTHALRWLLTQAQVDVNRCMTNGISALMAAAKDDHHTVVSILAHAGANLDATASDGRTALSIAAQHNAYRSAEVLLGAGASPNGTREADPSSDTDWGTQPDKLPLVVAARRGYVELVCLLARSGADVNVVLGDGRSLLLAIVDGVGKRSRCGQHPASGDPATTAPVRSDVVATLLDLGADPHQLSQEVADVSRRESLVTRRSPYSTARARGDPDLIAIFDTSMKVAGGEP